MTKEEAIQMINNQGVYEISYCKDNEERIWHISNIEFSPRYGQKYILARCHEINKDLTFNIDKISSFSRYWVDIMSEDEKAPEDGLYILMERGDMCLGKSPVIMKKEELFMKHGWDEDLIAYHFVKEFDLQDDSDNLWDYLRLYPLVEYTEDNHIIHWKMISMRKV